MTDLNKESAFGERKQATRSSKKQKNPVSPNRPYCWQVNSPEWMTHDATIDQTGSAMQIAN
jgi:hypothetical protein